MRESYRNSDGNPRLGRILVRSIVVVVTALVIAGSAFGQGRFSAADVPRAGVRQPGKVTIRNNGAMITAYHFFGDISKALFSLRSSPARLPMTPFGAAVYESTARVNAPMPTYLSALMSDAGRAHGVDPRLLAAVALRESAFDPNVVSRTGACGIMQLMPATARFLGVANVFDARENVFGGALYLRSLLDTFGGDLDLTLAAYNAGPGAVQRHKGVPPYRETQAYVKYVRAAYERSLRTN